MGVCLGRDKNVKIPFWIWNSCFKCSMISEYVTKTEIFLKYTRFEELRETWLGLGWLTAFATQCPSSFPCVFLKASFLQNLPLMTSTSRRAVSGMRKELKSQSGDALFPTLASHVDPNVLLWFLFYNLILQNNIRLFSNALQITFWNTKPLICGSSLLSMILVQDWRIKRLNRMALQGKAFASKPEDLSSTPRTHTRKGENSLQNLFSNSTCKELCDLLFLKVLNRTSMVSL